jgi:hypothetical protein
LKRISNVPVDPLLSTYYTYSLSANRKTYQIASAQEWSIAYNHNPFVNETFALNAQNLYWYTLGSRIDYDTPIISGASCSIIATPSIILSDIPAGWVLTNNSIYNYTYLSSPNIPNSYSWSVVNLNSADWFQTVEVLDTCSINSIWDLELYLAKLSTAYIWLSSLPRYEDIVFNSNSQRFQLNAINTLQGYGILIDQWVIDTVESPDPDYVFTDTFTNTNDTNLVSTHTPGSGLWQMLWSWDTSAYSISGNTLEKNGWTNTIVWPLPNPLITNKNYNISFDIWNFSSWNVSVYLRYIDDDNYYSLELSPSGYPITTSGYQVIRRSWWVDSILETIWHTISAWDNIAFSVHEDTVAFELNAVEISSTEAGWLNFVWAPGIMMQNNGAQIDNFTLTYK